MLINSTSHSKANPYVRRTAVKLPESQEILITGNHCLDINVIANSMVSKGMSGGDRIFIELCRRWGELGHNIHLYVSETGYEVCEDNKLKANYHIISRFAASRYGLILSYTLRILKALISVQSAQEGSIIYSSSDFLPDTVPAYMMKKKNKGRWVAGLYLIAPNPFQGPPLGIRGHGIRSLLYFLSQKVSILLMKQCADLIWVPNNDTKEFLKKKGLPYCRIRVINAGVDMRQVSEAQAKNKVYDACFVGRFHSQKGIFDLIRIWEYVCTKRRNAKLALIGYGSADWRNKLFSELYRKGLEENIDFLGFIGDKEKFEVLKSSKVFVFPSIYESWGLVACEAMACGLPVVAYDLPVFREIFPRGMVTIRIGDSKAFADEVIDLLENDDRREKLGKEALEIASKYDWYNVAKETLSHLTELQ